MMIKYNLYIGLTGKQELTYVGTDIYDEIEEANFDAYILAFGLYEKYEGTKDYPDIFQVAQIHNLDYDEDEEKVSDIYSEVVESLIKYKVIPTDEDSVPENKLINL